MYKLPDPTKIDEEKQLFVYSHKVLRDAVEANGLVAKIELKTFLPGRVVAEATITDPSNGYTVTEVGSVTRNVSEIGQEFPVEVAYSAAYDHAAVVILGLDTGENAIWSYSHTLDNQSLPEEGNGLLLQDGNGLIAHRTLKCAARKDQRFSWSYKLLVCTEDAVIVECTIKDRARGREFTDIGTALDSNIRTGEEKNFPVELAYNRAFDRAAIAALYNSKGLPEGVRGIWSNMEILPTPPVFAEAEKTTLPAADTFDATEVFAKEPAKEGPSTDPTTTEQASEPAPVGDDDEKILFGICKGKTFGQIRGTEEEKKTIAWVINSGIEYPDEARNAQVARFRAMAT